MEDTGRTMSGKIKIRTDASAAIGIANRIGVGKVRHIEVNQLRLQDKVQAGIIKFTKVGADENLADALTKGLESNKLNWQT